MTGGYRPQDTGATAPQTVRNQPSSVQPPHCCEADRLLVHALDNASAAIGLAERYEAALREIARLGNLVAHDLQGRVEAGKVMAVQRMADTAQEALADGR